MVAADAVVRIVCLARVPLARVLLAWMLVSGLAGCAAEQVARPGDRLERRGDEIVIAGQFFHTGTPVVLWTDPGGYDAYRVERRFDRIEASGWEHIKNAVPSPNRYNQRPTGDANTDERVRGGGWTLDDLRPIVDQFVLHYDVCGSSRTCFRVLHDLRGLSVHFMLDLDGTIYQTLDVKERAWHATKANGRSVGIEIANIGAYPDAHADPLREWYDTASGRTAITVPDRFGDAGFRRPENATRPARDLPVRGTINGSSLVMYDLTDAQYEALIRLTAALHRALPNIDLRAPRTPGGGIVDRALTDDEFASFRGVLGHWHVQENKTDPGPALDWDRVLEGAQRILAEPAR